MLWCSAGKRKGFQRASVGNVVIFAAVVKFVATVVSMLTDLGVFPFFAQLCWVSVGVTPCTASGRMCLRLYIRVLKACTKNTSHGSPFRKAVAKSIQRSRLPLRLNLLKRLRTRMKIILRGWKHNNTSGPHCVINSSKSLGWEEDTSDSSEAQEWFVGQRPLLVQLCSFVPTAVEEV